MDPAPNPGFEPRTFLLWANSANPCTINIVYKIKINCRSDCLLLYTLTDLHGRQDHWQTAILEYWDMSWVCLHLPASSLSLKSCLGSEHTVLFSSGWSLMFYSASPVKAVGTVQPCPVPSPPPFLGSIRPCLRVPLAISPGWHAASLARCLVFWSGSASCATAYIHQSGLRWRDEEEEREWEKEKGGSGQSLSLSSL